MADPPDAVTAPESVANTRTNTVPGALKSTNVDARATPAFPSSPDTGTVKNSLNGVSRNGQSRSSETDDLERAINEATSCYQIHEAQRTILKKIATEKALLKKCRERSKSHIEQINWLSGYRRLTGHIGSFSDENIDYHSEKASVNSIGRADAPRQILSDFNELSQDIEQIEKSLDDSIQDYSAFVEDLSRLNLQKERVDQCIELVQQVQSLKKCIKDLHDAMEAQNWFFAAETIDKARKVPYAVREGKLARTIVPYSGEPDPPETVLNNSANTLSALFSKRFLESARVRDETAITKYFKLFPKIGRAERGIELYSDFVCEIISEKNREMLNGKNSPMFFAEVYSSLLKHIIMIIKSHGPLIFSECGPEFLKITMEKIQKMCDSRSEMIFDRFWDERKIARLLYDIQCYEFPFLTRVLNPGGSGAGSAVHGQKDHVIPRSTIDAPQCDQILNEMAAIVQDWNTYQYFMTMTIADASGNFKRDNDQIDVNDGSILDDRFPTPIIKERDLFLTQCQFTLKVMPLILSTFRELELWFFRRSFEKALEYTEDDTSNEHPFSSFTDDTMYLLKLVLGRALRSGSFEIVNSVVGGLNRILEGDFYGTLARSFTKLQAQLKQTYDRAKHTISTTNIQTISDSEKEERAAMSVFLNNCCFSNRNSQQIISSFLDDPQIASLYLFDEEYLAVKKSVRSLSKFQSFIATLRTSAIEEAFQSHVRLKIRTIISDSFDTEDFRLSSLGFEAASQNLALSSLFNRTWDTSLDVYSDLLDSECLDALSDVMIQALIHPLQERIFDVKCTDYGAILLDTEISAIIAHICRSYSMRDHFVAINEILTVINSEFRTVDSVRMELSLEHLSNAEISRSLAMIVDENPAAQ